MSLVWNIPSVRTPSSAAPRATGPGPHVSRAPPTRVPVTSGGSTHPRFPDSADRGVVKETQGDKAAGARGLMTPHPRLSRVTPCPLISGSRRRRCVGDTLTRHCETLVILAPLTGKGCGLSSEVTSCLPQLPTVHCNDARRLPRQCGQGSAIARVRQGHWHSLCGIGAPCAITARIRGNLANWVRGS